MPKIHVVLISFISLAGNLVAQPVIAKKFGSNLNPDFTLPANDNSALIFGGNVITKIDSAGNVKWAKSYAYPNDNSGHYLQFAEASTGIDSSITLVGKKTDSGEYGFCTRLDANGNILWNHNFFSYFPVCVSATGDSGAVICGGGLNGFAAKLKRNGTLEWQVSLGGEDEWISQAIKQTADSGFIVTGYLEKYITSSQQTKFDMMLCKLSKDGYVKWGKKYSSTLPSNNAVGVDVISEPIGYTCLIISDEGLILMRTDTAGNYVWSKNYPEYSGLILPSDSKKEIRLRKKHNTLLLANSLKGIFILTDTAGIVKREISVDMENPDAIFLKNKSLFIVGNIIPFPGNQARATNANYGGFVITDSLSLSPSCYPSYAGNASTCILIASGFNYVTSFEMDVTAPLNATVSLVNLPLDNGCVPRPVVGIDEKILASTIIYPDPLSGKITLQSDGLSGKNILFELYDITGEKVIRRELAFETDGAYIDLGDIRGSVYFYKLYEKNEPSKTGKLVIAR